MNARIDILDYARAQSIGGADGELVEALCDEIERLRGGNDKENSTASNALLEPRGNGSVVIPPEVLDLLRFMCATWTEIDKFVYEHCDGNALVQYPVVQGTANQINLMRIGEQPHDTANLRKAIKWMREQAV